MLGNINKFWGNTYVYDAWGNLTQKKLMTNQCSGENLSVTVDTNNRFQSGYGYDITGNMVHDATENLNYTFDQENRIVGVAPFTYTYDVDGNRVEKSNGSTTPSTGTFYWYMSMGIVGESDLAGNLQSEYIFFGGECVARKDFPGKTVSYYFSDHLKTASVITDAIGTIKAESDYYPWGGELQFTNNDSNHYKFTGKERDAETGLDYFGARYYSNGLGRFITPDWAEKATVVPYAELADPQTLNLYSYVRNLPTSKVDKDGHCVEDLCIGEVIVVSAAVKWTVGLFLGAVAAVVTYNNFSNSNKMAPPPRAVPQANGNAQAPSPPGQQQNNKQNDKKRTKQNMDRKGRIKRELETLTEK